MTWPPIHKRISAWILLFLLLAGLSRANDQGIEEGAILVSYAQDLYRQNGLNMPRSAFKLEKLKEGQRIFIINVISQSITLSDDMLQAFLVGGAVSQHARAPLDYVLLFITLEFNRNQTMVLQASGECCENLYNNRITVDYFTQSCLRMKSSS